MEKKKMYISPNISIIELEGIMSMAAVSKTQTDSPDGSETEGPEWGGDGDGEDAG